MGLEGIINQAFGIISQYTAAGAQSSGQVAAWLGQLGYGAEEIAAILQGVANQAAGNPQIIAYTTTEATYAQPTWKKWIFPAAIVVGLWCLSRRSDDYSRRND